VGQDKGLEVEVTDPKEKVGEGKAGETEGTAELKLERLQGR
jgi:hypothetical protein